MMNSQMHRRHVILRYSEGSARSNRLRRSFGVPQDDTSLLSRCALLVMLSFSLCAIPARASAAPEPPHSPDPSVNITLFASEPDIVTPIGATVDAHGRLLVIESHSHFRPKNYQGPATDRIRILQDTTGTGKADKITTFFEGQNFLMNLVGDRDGSIVVSSRNEIFRLIEDNIKGIAGPKIPLAHLETKADYPHNGLHGLATDREGNVYFSIGENFGTPWTLIGTDGQKLSDDRGAGAVFRVDSKGRGLTRIARGFWNPFALGFDPAGTLWAVDNDPDGRPPSRLIHIVPGGDYGFEFRYGRTGMHPLQAWDGELPGTLGMVAGVGEAPCAVQWNRGRLLVSSWRDHEIESFKLIPRGATYTTEMKPLLTGGVDFRPVGLAFSPDGAIFVTDWASNSYPVHGKGRVWKLTFAHPASADADVLKPTDAMNRAAGLRQSENINDLITALDDNDPTIAQAAQHGLSRLPQSEKIGWAILATPRQRVGLLAALLWRGSDLQKHLPLALKDPDDRVRQMAVRCIAEQGLTESRQGLEQLLASQVLSPRLLGMTVAAISQLNGDKSGKIDAAQINAVLLDRMNSPAATDQTKATALHMMLASHPKIPLDQIKPLLQSPSVPLQLEAVRYLDDDATPARFALLAQIAADLKVDPSIRAEAIVGLADDAAAQFDLLLKLTDDDNASLRHEALRSLRPLATKLTHPQRTQILHRVDRHPADAPLIAAWQKIVDQAPGDPEAGRRIFFQHGGAGCYNCHTLEGRGRAIGPDLSMIGHSQTRDHVLESILDPSREIAPLFTLWTITTKSGEKIDGMLLRRDGQSKEVYVDSTGKETTIPESQIVDRKIRKESLMPTGLVQGLTDQELRDLIALLMQKR